VNATLCHPERSLAKCEANCRTETEDPVPADGAITEARNFRIVVRFFDEREAECVRISRREAASLPVAKQP
jgi:hypothetical protein